jgi:hypothetical protein
LIVNTEGSWTVQLWILSGSILAAAAEAAMKGSVACAVTRLAMLERYRNVGSFHANPGERALLVNGRVLDGTTLVDPG